jgi:hypothetical protein
MSNAYGRPYRRRKAARFYPGIVCSICGEPVRTRAEFTLHHDPPVSRGGTAFDEKPAHKSCNLEHGRRLGGTTNSRRRGQVELEQGRIPSRRTRTGAPRYRKVWEGALGGPLTGPAEVHRRDGSIIIVHPGERYEP